MKEKKVVLQKTTTPIIEVFPNPSMGRGYEIFIEAPEFTSVCPMTGQPDFGTIQIKYVPDKVCIELKSLKFYLQQYRNKGIFYEELTNRILDDLVASCRPMSMEISSTWHPRGGISTRVSVSHKKSGPAG